MARPGREIAEGSSPATLKLAGASHLAATPQRDERAHPVRSGTWRCLLPRSFFHVCCPICSAILISQVTGNESTTASRPRARTKNPGVFVEEKLGAASRVHSEGSLKGNTFTPQGGQAPLVRNDRLVLRRRTCPGNFSLAPVRFGLPNAELTGPRLNSARTAA